MKLRMLPALCAVLLLLTGCASLLERTYTSVEPHSSKFWESEAAGTLRAENYQDIVNDLLPVSYTHLSRRSWALSQEKDSPAAEKVSGRVLSAGASSEGLSLIHIY